MSYGFMTHSYLNSTEHRQMKRERQEFTEKYLRGEIKFEPVTILLCHCRSFKFSHDVSEHRSGPRKLLSDHDWRTPEERGNMQIFDERVL
jgi:hypothetical protein